MQKIFAVLLIVALFVGAFLFMKNSVAEYAANKPEFAYPVEDGIRMVHPNGWDAERDSEYADINETNAIANEHNGNANAQDALGTLLEAQATAVILAAQPPVEINQMVTPWQDALGLIIAAVVGMVVIILIISALF